MLRCPPIQGIFSRIEVLANTEMPLALDAPTSVSVVRKRSPTSLSTPGSQANLPSPHHAMTDESADASLFSGETVSSKMLMMGFSTAPTAAAAAAPVSLVTHSAVTQRPKVRRHPTAQKPQAAEQPPQPKLSWWGGRFPRYCFLSRVERAAVICLLDCLSVLGMSARGT